MSRGGLSDGVSQSLNPPAPSAGPMRILVTGAGNPTGRAIVAALLEAGHQVRVFGDAASAIAPFEGRGEVSHFPGDLRIAGSIEPALSERQALVHAACCDEPGKDRLQHAIKVERGTLYARYGAEREQVDHFIHVAPAAPGRAFALAQANALKAVGGLQGTLRRTVVKAAAPQEAAAAVLQALDATALLGKQPGRENDAVTA